MTGLEVEEGDARLLLTVTLGWLPWRNILLPLWMRKACLWVAQGLLTPLQNNLKPAALLKATSMAGYLISIPCALSCYAPNKEMP